MADNKLSAIEAEAGVIASVLLKPELIYHSEDLTPHHFTDTANGYIYYCVRELLNRDITTVDAYNIMGILNSNPTTARVVAGGTITVPILQELFDVAPSIARGTPPEYKVFAEQVMDIAFRNEVRSKLQQCEQMCLNRDADDIRKKIYETLDSVMLDFSPTNEVPQYAEVVEQIWAEIQERQRTGLSGYPFIFPTLNEYVTIEPSELVLFAAPAKGGKSQILLNQTVDMLKRGLSVLYLDSELNSRMFTLRLIAHLTGISYINVKTGRYDETERQTIDKAIAWLKTRKFTHIYLPTFTTDNLYTVIKKVHHTQNLDVVVVDYIKSSENNVDAFGSYMEYGRLTTFFKSEIAGSMGLACVGAVQATSTGHIANSANIGRFASTVILLQDKTPEEIERDSEECGNKKLVVILNRNGMQHSPGEYIDVMFDGNHILFTEAKQHIPDIPY